MLSLVLQREENDSFDSDDGPGALFSDAVDRSRLDDLLKPEKTHISSTLNPAEIEPQDR
jgi:hypothetical protein